MAAPPLSTASGSATVGSSRVPYLPGLDGLRAIAVVAVMIYHANHRWLPGGFLGVEVFFVISGYLITLLLIGEHERDGGVNLRQFWLRRFRRLLPALYVMMALIAVYICAFYPVVRAQTRGDFVAGVFYVSNWYQIFVGQGYASSEAFVPLRHLWSLAVEEQFYLLWPVVMVLVLRRWRRRLPSVGVKLMGVSLGITVLIGIVFVGGYVPLTCTAENSNGYWHVFGRCISVNDTLYLSSITRAGGLMLGAGFAMMWRPHSIVRGPLRFKFRQLDVIAGVGLLVLLLLMGFMYLFDNGAYNPWLFRGGFFIAGVATLMVIAAATHSYASTGGLLGNRLFKWVGTRSYGLYLYHWPIYQIIRKQAQIGLTLPKMILAMLLTVPITELSYRFLETPIRQGRLRSMARSIRRDPRQLMAALSVVVLLGVTAGSMMVADAHCVGAVECSLVDNSSDSTQPTSPSTSVAVTTPGASTSSTSTTTTIPRVPEKFIAFGESVMLGAKSELQGAGVFVDAKESRGAEGIKNAIIKRRDGGYLGKGTTVVVQVGTNGPISDAALADIMAAVPLNATRVVFMTVHAPDFWIAPNNTRIKALPTIDKTVHIIDWDAQSKNTKLCPDGVHVTCNVASKQFYANLVLKELGLPAIK